MSSVLTMVLLWGLFAGTHIGFATTAVRGRVIGSLGKPWHTALYSLVATAVFAAMVVFYAGHRLDGPRGLGLAAIAPLRPLLIASVVLGMMLLIGGFAPSSYRLSPMAPFNTTVREPHGLERITRHPFFAGLVLVFGAHALLSTHLIGTVFFGGFVCTVLGGATHQAAKLTDEMGPSYRAFVDKTSAVPFVAIFRGKQSLHPGEQPWVFLALGVGVAMLMRYYHEEMLALSGLPLILAIAGSAWFFLAEATWRTRRDAAREAAEPRAD